MKLRMGGIGLMVVVALATEAQAQHSGHEEAPGATSDDFAGFLARPLPLRAGVGRVTAGPLPTDSVTLYFEQALAFQYSYMYLDAARSFRMAVRLDPTFAEGYAGLGRAYASLNRSEAARAVRDTAAALVASADQATRWRVLLRDPQRRGQDWRTAADAAVVQEPQDIELLMLHAAAATGQERIRRYREVLRLVPNHVGAHHLLIHAHEPRREYDMAVRHGEQLAAEAWAVPHPRHMLGHNLLRVGRVPEAGREFEVADSLERAYHSAEGIPTWYDWHHPHNLHLLGQAYWHQGRFADAERVLRRRAELETSTGRPQRARHNDVVEILLSAGHIGQALDLARSLVAGQSQQSRQIASALVAEALITMDRSDEAEHYVRQAGDRNPRSAVGRYAARAHAMYAMATLGEGRAAEYVEGILPDLLVDRGPDGFVASLMHMDALARMAVRSGMQDLATRLINVINQHDPTLAVGHQYLRGHLTFPAP